MMKEKVRASATNFLTILPQKEGALFYDKALL